MFTLVNYELEFTRVNMPFNVKKLIKQMHNFERMGNSEAEIMKILWKRNGKATTSSEILKALENKVEWTRSTILTLLRRLVEKGFVSCNKESIFYYTPLVSKSEYQKYQTINFIDKIYDGNVKNLISGLCWANCLSKDDITELQAYLEMEVSGDD